MGQLIRRGFTPEEAKQRGYCCYRCVSALAHGRTTDTTDLLTKGEGWMSAAYGGMRPVVTIQNHWDRAGESLGVVARGLRSHAQAWDWIDRNTAEGRADYDRYCRATDAFSKSPTPPTSGAAAGVTSASG